MMHFFWISFLHCSFFEGYVDPLMSTIYHVLNFFLFWFSVIVEVEKKLVLKSRYSTEEVVTFILAPG